MVVDNIAFEVKPEVPTTTVVSCMSEMPESPTSVASVKNFPFTSTDMLGMGIDTSALDSTFQTDVASAVVLQLDPGNGANNSRDSLRSLDQIHWNFSLADLTADLSNLGEILLDYSEKEDRVEEYFVDSVPGQPDTPS
ncbi:hypothetical protein V6N13_132000 [Hibiscus sabdariffa]